VTYAVEDESVTGHFSLGQVSLGDFDCLGRLAESLEGPFVGLDWRTGHYAMSLK
jgi:hypothetical protein